MVEYRGKGSLLLSWDRSGHTGQAERDQGLIGECVKGVQGVVLGTPVIFKLAVMETEE